MKICITSSNNTLDSAVDPRFGRCKYFIVAETDDMTFEAIENPNMSSGGGAGIQSGQFIAGKSVKTVLTGNVGPNAFQTLKAAKISIITGVSGKVSEAIEKYKKGEFKETDNPSVGPKFGVQ